MLTECDTAVSTLNLKSMPSKMIDSYQLFISEGGQQKAYISCWKDGAFQGYIDFFDLDDLQSPSINSNGSLHLSYPVERLDSVVSLLREESPVYISIWGIAPNLYCRVSTTNEPIGEEEGN